MPRSRQSQVPERPPEPAEVRRLRRRIDALDRRIVRLLNERSQLAVEIGHRKRAARQPVRDGEREREVLLRVAMANDGPLSQSDLLALYRKLISVSRRMERMLRR